MDQERSITKDFYALGEAQSQKIYAQGKALAYDLGWGFACSLGNFADLALFQEASRLPLIGRRVASRLAVVEVAEPV